MRLIDADDIKYQLLKPNTNPTLWCVSKDAVDLMPTVDAVPVVHGHWILEEKTKWFPDWKCSICGGSGRGDHIFCEWCGAKMDEVTE